MDFNELNAGIKYPYAVISDIHIHDWSAFSNTGPNGVNNRLQIILDAIEEAGEAILAKGGRDLIITGDLFHTRGVLKPSVINPTIDLFEKLLKRGLRIFAFDGNHDCELKHTSEYGSAMYMLGKLENFTVFYEPTLVDGNKLFLPWIEEPKEVLNQTAKGSTSISNLTLFAHVGLSGVIPGNLGNVLNADDLLELDIKYAFIGHFHNHVSFDARVYSIGALTHQTWGDVGTLAGYLIVHKDKVEHFETQAPKFVDLMVGNPEDHDYNYVRIKGEWTEEQMKDVKDFLKTHNVLGYVDQSTRPTIIEKDHLEAVKVDLGLETALETYCKHMYGTNWEKVYQACLKLKK